MARDSHVHIMAHRHRYFVLVSLAVVLLAPHATAQPWQECGSIGSFTANSTYQANLGLLAAALPRKISSSPDLFATAVVGSVPDQVAALALCRGDTNATACSSCLATAFQDVQNMCPYDRGAAIYYDRCNLYYSPAVSVLSYFANEAVKSLIDLENVTSDPGRFNRQVAALVNACADYAAYNSTRRYASGEAELDGEFPKVYSWAQCTPDMMSVQCRRCLAGIIATRMPRLFTDRLGGRTLGARCSYRYEMNLFYDGQVMVRLAALPSSAPAPAVEPPGSNSVVGEGSRNWERVHNTSLPMLDLSTLKVATDNFADVNKLGEGGFGVVYKGTLSDGQEIAVKRLSPGSAQGIGELKAELVLVAKLQHKNLVRLIGVCLEEHEKLIIYEYMPNKSLDTILFDPEKSKDLDWDKRFKIINGISRGLQYVHEDSLLKIIHRDLKASNILLDSNLNPKISDFGLARLFEGDQSKDVTNRVVGTFGYMPPEYVVRGHYSTKSDVFSFGIMVLEIMTGRRNCASYNSEQTIDLLTDLIWEHWTKGTILEIIDQSIANNASEGQIRTYVHIGLLCVQESPAERPTMSGVNAILNSDGCTLQYPSKPALCFRESSADPEPHQGVSHSGSRLAVVSPNEVSLTELEPR